MKLTGEWLWQVIAASAAAVLAMGGAHVADRVITPPACRGASGFGPFGDDPVVDGDLSAAVLLKLAENMRSFTGKDVRTSVAPAVTPGYQQLRPGEAGRWEVAVLQLGGTSRSLDVNYGDGGPHTRMGVPAGSGACRFTVTRTYPHPAGRRELRFTVGELGSTSTTGPPPGGDGFSATAFVDVIEGP